MVEWDVSLTEQNGRLMVGVPTAISKPLMARGLNRVRVSVTEEGILLVPYAGVVSGGKAEVVIPEGWGS